MNEPEYLHLESLPVGIHAYTPDSPPVRHTEIPSTYLALAAMVLIMLIGIVLAFKGHKAAPQPVMVEDQGSRRPLNQFERVLLALVVTTGTLVALLLLFPGDTRAGQSAGVAGIGMYLGSKGLSRQTTSTSWIAGLNTLLASRAQRRAFIILLVGLALMVTAALYEAFYMQSPYSSSFWGRRILWGPLRAVRITMNPETNGGLLLLFWIGTTMSLYGISRAFLSRWLWHPIQRWINQQ